MRVEKAYFAAGCFWSIQAAFDDVPGVVSTTVGYAGGRTEDPTYEKVCSGKTMHAETVEVEYDPAEVSYRRLLEEFWGMHDPTQLNMQGPDVGTQYRSAVFYVTEEQKKEAEESLKNEQGKYTRRIMTEVKPLNRFYPAEEYHQHYLKKKGTTSFS
jgi:peptide-methionine (S)-S-oxide reductase